MSSEKNLQGDGGINNFEFSQENDKNNYEVSEEILKLIPLQSADGNPKK